MVDAHYSSTALVAEIAELRQINRELLEALKVAVDAIHALHDLPFEAGQVKKCMWDLYQASAEMKAIKAAIKRAEGK